MNSRDVYNLHQTYKRLITQRYLSADPALITFHRFARTDDNGEVARFLDNAGDNPWIEESGFTSQETTLQIPCSLVDPEITSNLVQRGYLPQSDLEVEISADELTRYDINIAEIRNQYEYITILAPDTIGMQGRPILSKTQLWDIISVRFLSIASSIFAIRISLVLREANADILEYQSIKG